MKRFRDMKTHAKLALLGGALTLAAGPAGALDIYLATKPYLKSLPDGTAVPMWGYVLDADASGNGIGDCWEAADETTRLACIEALGTPSVPGPRLTVPPTDASLTINLSNGLSEPTSVVIPGQALPVGSAATFVEPTDPSTVAATGTRTSLTQRFRSYGNEAPANGGAQTYTWNLTRSGTFLYHSGTWPQKQVYMGLYGAVTKDFAAGEVYAGVPYTNEVVLFYSDLDPVLNSAIASGTYTTSVDYHAQWFLVNGEPYVAGVTADLPAGAPGETTLLRLLSAASESHVPTLQGLHMSIHAEDGFQYGWEDTTAGTSGLSPREQYSAELPPLKTKDAILTLPATEGRFAVYDGNGYMTNPSDPNDYTVADTLGGMLRFLSVTPAVNTAPVAVDDAYTTSEDLPLTVAAPGVLGNDTDVDGDTLTAGLVSGPANGTVVLGSNGAFLYTPNANYNGSDTFTYVAFDGTVVSNQATVTITVTPENDAPVAIDDAYTTTEDIPLTVAAPGVLGNDTDVDGDTLTAGLVSGPANGTVVLGSNGAFLYTPNANYNGSDTFTYVAFDGTVVSNQATVTITVTPGNDAPVVTPVADQTSAEGDSVSLQVTATDGDGDTLSYSATGLPPDLTIDSVSGLISGTVAAGASTNSPYSVTVSVSDGTDTTVVSFAWTVTTVVAPTDTLYFSTSGNSLPPGVTGTADDADIYRWDGTVFSRVVDVTTIGVPGGANVDGMVFVSPTDFYLSFASDVTLVIGQVQDEDIVRYNNGVWSVYFDGTPSLGSSGSLDIDAFDIEGGVIYFSTVGNANPPGVTGTADDSDIYSWNGSIFSRVVDVTTIGVPTSANTDALELLSASEFYLSFNNDVTLPVIGLVQDEDVVKYTNGTWSVYFDGTAKGLTAGGHDIDAVQLP